MGGLKAQLLHSAQGSALGLSEFVFLSPCKGKSPTDSVVFEKASSVRPCFCPFRADNHRGMASPRAMPWAESNSWAFSPPLTHAK